MKLNQIVSAGLLAAAALAAPHAQAAFIVGSASGTGFFENSAALDLPDALVSTLTMFDVASSMAVGSTSGDLAPNTLTGTAFDFSISSVPQQMFVFNGFTFVIQEWAAVNATPLTCADDQCSDGIGFSGNGFVTGNGFQSTGFTMGWSAQGSCNENLDVRGECGSNPTASWSASISATGEAAQVIPAPATLALVGLALVGAGLSRRRQG